MVYGGELIIYDKHRRCMLTEGDYEVALQDLDNKVQSKKQATWETVMDGKVWFVALQLVSHDTVTCVLLVMQLLCINSKCS